jgi:hypothetical protein
MKLIPALACSALLLGGAAYAADTTAPTTTSTAKPAAKMDECAKQAKSQKLKGKARKDFLKTCRADKAK